MKSKKSFAEKSYQSHEQVFKKYFDKEKMYSWTRDDTVDAWRHRRMRECLNPILDTYISSNWLAVGDGKYGTDAHYIESKNSTALATDISDYYLKKAKLNGYIKSYKVENAESLSFSDDEFDFVLCKESFHHFPRPMIALYEMLRVASKAVVLIEPNDENIIDKRKLSVGFNLINAYSFIKNVIKFFLGRKPYQEYGDYEVSGNYVYTLSRREVEKVALGLNFNMIATKGLNDYYLEGVEFEKADNKSKLFKEIKKFISRADKKCKIGICSYAIMVTVIFKEKPQKSCIDRLERTGFDISELPKNPYIK